MKKSIPPKRQEIRLRVAPEIKAALQSLAKSRGTTINNLGVLLINDMLQKKPGLMDALSWQLTFKPGINPILLREYRNLVEIYSLIRFKSTQECLQPHDCARFMEAAGNLIQSLSNI